MEQSAASSTMSSFDDAASLGRWRRLSRSRWRRLTTQPWLHVLGLLLVNVASSKGVRAESFAELQTGTVVPVEEFGRRADLGAAVAARGGYHLHLSDDCTLSLLGQGEVAGVSVTSDSHYQSLRETPPPAEADSILSIYNPGGGSGSQSSTSPDDLVATARDWNGIYSVTVGPQLAYRFGQVELFGEVLGGVYRGTHSFVGTTGGFQVGGGLKYEILPNLHAALFLRREESGLQAELEPLKDGLKQQPRGETEATFLVGGLGFTYEFGAQEKLPKSMGPTIFGERVQEVVNSAVVEADGKGKSPSQANSNPAALDSVENGTVTPSHSPMRRRTPTPITPRRSTSTITASPTPISTGTYTPSATPSLSPTSTAASTSTITPHAPVVDIDSPPPIPNDPAIPSVMVPNVRWYSGPSARAHLRSVGLDPDDDGRGWFVWATNPRAGTIVTMGSRVRISFLTSRRASGAALAGAITIVGVIGFRRRWWPRLRIQPRIGEARIRKPSKPPELILRLRPRRHRGTVSISGLAPTRRKET